MLGVEVNLVGIMLATIAAMVVGFLWYSNSMFGKEWRELVGLEEDVLKNSKAKMPLLFGASALAFVVMAYVLAHVLSFMDATTTYEGVQTGFLMWLGFVATSMLVNILYQNRKLKLFFIDSFYMLIVLLIAGGILVNF